ncbi:MAG: hypothetical protein KDA68_05470 [Planctomycetaceae bacterium]|nr:hypothetical protein [Planctomycetaceae bacterium]
MALTWNDLIIDQFNPEQVEAWIEPWNGTIQGQIAPVFFNKFGAWFLRRPQGYVEMLDVFTGSIQRISNTYEEFIAEVNQPWWQEAYLLSAYVSFLHDAGKIPDTNQCYALAPHPALGGPNPACGDAIEARFVMIMDMLVWQRVCSQAVNADA